MRGGAGVVAVDQGVRAGHASDSLAMRHHIAKLARSGVDVVEPDHVGTLRKVGACGVRDHQRIGLCVLGSIVEKLRVSLKHLDTPLLALGFERRVDGNPGPIVLDPVGVVAAAIRREHPVKHSLKAALILGARRIARTDRALSVRQAFVFV